MFGTIKKRFIHGSDIWPLHGDLSFDFKGSGVTECVSHRWLDLDFSEQDFGDTKTVYFPEEELLAWCHYRFSSEGGEGFFLLRKS